MSDSAEYSRGRADGLKGAWFLQGINSDPDYAAGYHQGVADRYADIPALSPDNDYEDTLARFSGLHVGIPPYPGYEGRPVVEDFPLPAPAKRSSHLITLTAFLFGLGVGTVASALLG